MLWLFTFIGSYLMSGASSYYYYMTRPLTFMSKSVVFSANDRHCHYYQSTNCLACTSFPLHTDLVCCIARLCDSYFAFFISLAQNETRAPTTFVLILFCFVFSFQCCSSTFCQSFAFASSCYWQFNMQWCVASNQLPFDSFTSNLLMLTRIGHVCGFNNFITF